MSRKTNSVLLDVDPSIIENNLFITKQDENSDPSFQSLLNNLSGNTWDADMVDGEKRDISPQCKLVKPFPGFCVKTWKETGEKFFINVCHTEHIPQPDEISDEDLMKLLLASSEEGSSTDFGNLRSDFRVPMSIGKLHKETDKSGLPCDVCDVAVNTTFFNMKVLKNPSFKMFLMTVALEGVDDKYGVQIDYKKQPITLKHCKVMGKIEAQMVQNRSAGGSGGFNTNQTVKKQLIEEIPADKNRSSSTSGTTSAGSVTTPHCQYQILMDPESVAAKQTVPNYLTVNVLIKRPVITSGKDISLDVGEDRVLLRTSPSKQTSTANKRPDIIPVYDTFCDNSDSGEKVLLDIFLPYNVVRESCKARFNSDNRVLTIDMPVAA